MRKLFLILMTLVACGWSLTAQTRTYHGTVVDGANNEPLVGATIMPLGGGQGVATDADGKFTLNVPANVHQVKVTYIGYKQQTVSLQNNMVIYLTSTSSNLDDVVVVAYGTANKESLTGSVAVVGSKEIEGRPVTSVTSALEGNAPGVQINNSTTQPGQDPTIRVRGFSSINGNNDALIVVDGTEYKGDISALNPQDIESMSVLKDAASCALYGNRGANGVVLITTKKAKTIGKVDVTLQVRQGMYERALPMYDRLDANQWMETALSGLVNGRLTTAANQGVDLTFDQSMTYWRKNFIPSYAKLNIYDKADADLFDENGKLAAQMLPGYAGDLDWWKSVSRTGHRQEYNLNIAGATDKLNVFASAGYLKENGYVLQTGFERFNGRLNVTAEPVKYLRIGMNLAAQHSESEVSPVESDALDYTNNPFSVTLNNAPIYPYYAHNADGSIIYNEDGTPAWNDDRTSSYLKNGNICWQIREDRRNYSVTTIDASLYGTAILPYGFEFTVKGAMYRDKTNQMEYNNDKVGSQRNVGALSETFYKIHTHTFMQQLNWSHDYGMHHVDVLLDHENYAYKNGYTFTRKSGQELQNMLTMNNFRDMMDMTEVQYEYKSESYLGRARYNFNQKYFAEASLRRDGSSRFDKDNRWGTFWSVGASWIISKEKFMQNLHWLNYLKLRAAYGSVGNDASADAYAYRALYGFGWAIEGSSNILVPSQLAPENLKWEATKTLDVALEGSLFNDRFNFSIGYYNKRNSDLLFWVSAPFSAGAMGNTGSTPQTLKNIGTMQNIGWELAFGVDIIRNQNIRWSFNIDASFLKNKIIKLPDGKDIPGDGLFQGKSLFEQYTYEWAGVDQMTGQSLYAMNPDSPDFYYYDDNNNLVYNDAEWQSNLNNARSKGALVEIGGQYYTTNRTYAGRKIMGTSLPTVYGSFGTNVSWKGINLGLLFTYSLGGKRYDTMYGGLMSMSQTVVGALHKDLLNSWSGVPEGMTEDSPNRIDPNGIPQINTTNSAYNNAGSSRWLTSNSYLTLKNINLSYDFPSKWVRAMKMQNLNLGFSVDNVFIASKRKGMNPQYNFGGDVGAYFVPARVYSFQLTVKF